MSVPRWPPRRTSEARSSPRDRVVESRYDPLALSRIEGTGGVLGHYASDQPPKRLNKKGSLYCGPLQTYAKSWDECMGQRKNSTSPTQPGARDRRAG